MGEKKKFTGKIGFILTAAGSAVGLGNLWRFPYLAAKYGGGTFLLTYLILAVTFGFTLMLTEITIGRKTGASVLRAFGILNEKYKFIGYLTAIVPIIIFPYYCVIGGWVVKYFTVYLAKESMAAAQDTYFESFISQTTQPILFLSIFLIATAGIVVGGVEKGIEKFNKILMPILILLSIFVAGYGLTVPGSMSGLMYYITPDFHKVSFQSVVAAAGQLFYSLSLAMGIMITYGSYMKKDEKIESCVKYIEIFDTGIAFIAGLIVVPAVFAFAGGEKAASTSGPSLMFVMLPKIFANMKFGSVIGGAFFMLVLLAAITSSISLMETIVSMIEEKVRWNRKIICFIVIVIGFAMAIPSTLGFGIWSEFKILKFSILDFFDFISNTVLMPITALLMCLFVGYVLKPEAIAEEINKSEEFKRKKLYNIVIKYIAPIFLIIILATSIYSTFH
ncbi:NSS family neurotransmitter:Na+ symporter [Lachnotalea glycerini]|uniref:Transporter n=1 Tax=Lachnotalea glycerini TaxID=1763509 RepID=A0A255IAP6_9FIRM|nr:sodium-dependent transporter [Lachnotalea glycerini]PXV86838.1 NSS family neurotransmitter:Na+ symporter [Lachnotalea glycerini]RDY29578.1 sodium-dependent transporter [Lachnotalea glycerini]